MGDVLTSVSLAARPEFRVDAVSCREDRTRWSATEAPHGHRLVLVRRGRFRRRADGRAEELDPSVGYIGLPGDEENFAHPHGGDVCTAIGLSPRLWTSMAGEGGVRPAARRALYVDARVDLTHRRILASARAGDVDYALAEELLGLLGTALAQTTGRAEPLPGPAARDERDLVGAARAAIAEDHPAAAGLLPLAELLGVSPFRLSRAFPRELGVSLTRHRNRVRLGRALDRLEQGERDLAGLAADLGYADQAHLCRTMRRHIGRTPGELRSLLSAEARQGPERYVP